MKICIGASFIFYKECTEGKLDATWKVTKPMAFQDFLQNLGAKMLEYDPRKQRYPTEEKMRANTQTPIRRRRKQPSGPASAPSAPAAQQPPKAKEFSRKRGTLCTTVPDYSEHFAAMVWTENKRAVCAWCGKRTKRSCAHSSCQRRWMCAGTCFLNYHDPALVGLARSDRNASKLSTWTAPTDATLKEARKQWKALHPASK